MGKIKKNMDKKTKEIAKAYDAAHQLNRIANSLDEILRLVKEDQERSRKYMEKETDKPEEGKVYALTGAAGTACIANGNTWKEAEVKDDQQPAASKEEC
jgi:hypothetical protein